MFLWLGTTKKYSGNKKDKFNTQTTFNEIFENYQEGEEENLRWGLFTNNKTGDKTKKPYLFYEIITSDISLMTEHEINMILEKYSSLFTLTDEISFSQIKVD
jgi:hypothetical protein